MAAHDRRTRLARVAEAEHVARIRQRSDQGGVRGEQNLTTIGRGQRLDHRLHGGRMNAVLRLFDNAWPGRQGGIAKDVSASSRSVPSETIQDGAFNPLR